MPCPASPPSSSSSSPSSFLAPFPHRSAHHRGLRSRGGSGLQRGTPFAISILSKFPPFPGWSSPSRLTSAPPAGQRARAHGGAGVKAAGGDQAGAEGGTPTPAPAAPGTGPQPRFLFRLRLSRAGVAFSGCRPRTMQGWASAAAPASAGAALLPPHPAAPTLPWGERILYSAVAVAVVASPRPCPRTASPIPLSHDVMSHLLGSAVRSLRLPHGAGDTMATLPCRPLGSGPRSSVGCPSGPSASRVAVGSRPQ